MGHVGLESLRSIPIRDVAEPYRVRHLALLKNFSIDIGCLEQFLFPRQCLRDLFSPHFRQHFLNGSSFHFYFSCQFTEYVYSQVILNLF